MPVRVIVDSLPAPTEDEKSYRKRRERRDKLNLGAQIITAGLVFVYAAVAIFQWCEMRRSNKTTADTLHQLEIQNDLVKKQIVGTMGAVVTLNPSFSGTKINPVLQNSGHVVSPNAHLYFRWNIASLYNLNTSIREGNYSHTVPQLVIGGFNEPVDIGTKLGQEFSAQKYTVKIEGTYDFDNGFGDRFTERFCFTYLGHFQDLTEDGGIENGGPGFWPCGSATEKIRWVKAHPYPPKK